MISFSVNVLCHGCIIVTLRDRIAVSVNLNPSLASENFMAGFPKFYNSGGKRWNKMNGGPRVNGRKS